MIVYTRLGAIRCGGRHCLLFGKRDQPGCKNPSSCGGFPRIRPTLQPDVLQAASSDLEDVIMRLFVIFGASFSGKKALTYRFRTLSLLFYFADRGEHWKGVQSRTYRCTNSEDIEALSLIHI